MNKYLPHSVVTLMSLLTVGIMILYSWLNNNFSERMF